VAFTFDESLSDARSRVRSDVGDTVSPGLLPDATYDAVLAQTTARRQSFSCSADEDTFTAEGHGYIDGTAVILADLTASIGIAAGVIRYVRDADDDTFKLALTVTGAAIDLVNDGAGVVGVVDEAAATRQIARKLAVRYAQKPSDVRLTSGLSISWSERVTQWNLIAKGEAGGAGAKRAKGFTLRRGPARDYTTGEGDASE
jgi:hypothetical protein